MRLITATIVVLLLIASRSSDACSRRPHATDAQLYDEAKQVFVARITSTRVRTLSPAKCDDDDDECSYVEATYVLSHTIKGNPRRVGKVSDLVFGPGNCSLGLLAGWYYVFYVGSDSNFVPHIAGSFPVGPSLSPDDISELLRIKEPPHSRPRDDA
jgi:hypothetical protein